MTYSAGGLIQASDYNTFTTSAGGLNDIWATGSGDKGWGQTPFTSVSNNPPDTVTATQWATLVNRLATAGNQTVSTITSRTAPTVGTPINILSALSTDIATVTTNRGNSAGAGSLSPLWSGSVSKTTATGSGGSAWTITFTSTVAFPSADQARYFWNAGGMIRILYGKSSTGTDHDADWNTLAGQCGIIYFSGRVNDAAQSIGGVSYTGTTRIGGSGGTQTTLATTTGWYSLTGGAPATTIFQLNNASGPYSNEYIRTTAAVNAARTALYLTTTWVDDGTSTPGASSNISGGTDTPAPASAILGTAPTTLSCLIMPSTGYLTQSWGLPTITTTVL